MEAERSRPLSKHSTVLSINQITLARTHTHTHAHTPTLTFRHLRCTHAKLACVNKHIEGEGEEEEEGEDEG